MVAIFREFPPFDTDFLKKADEEQTQLWKLIVRIIVILVVIAN